MRIVALFCFLTILFISCNDNENEKLITGKWKGVEWLVNGQASDRNIGETYFNFDASKNYTFTYGQTEEKGTYKVENDMLFTKPAGQKEIMVKISKLTGDSLVFTMNRAGTEEVLTLIKN